MRTDPAILDARIARVDARLGKLLEERARLAARAAAKLADRLKPARKGRPTVPALDLAGWAPLVIIAVALLLPRLNTRRLRLARQAVSGPGEKLPPHFTTWEAWRAGEWRAEGICNACDAEGHGFELEAGELPREVREAVERAPSNFAVEGNGWVLNPDLWSEEDERSLMALGCLDGQQPTRILDTAWLLDGTTMGLPAGGKIGSARVPRHRWEAA